MIKLLYLDDFVKTECAAVIVSVSQDDGKNSVVLDQTVFCPQGGGQPYDTDVIESSNGVFRKASTRA